MYVLAVKFTNSGLSVDDNNNLYDKIVLFERLTSVGNAPITLLL